MNNDLKYLLVDMELSYALGYFFPSKKPQYMSARQIKQHQFCICASWKWLHEISVYSVSVCDNKKRFKENYTDDFIVAKKLHELFTQADVIVAHNGDAFDIKHANTLFIKHGLGQIPERKSIDTLKAARKYFAFAGNSLGDLLKLFKLGSKEERPDWTLLTEGDQKEIKKATKYCKKDVIGLEKIFLHIRPYIRNMPHMRYINGIVQCDACGSKRLHKKGLEWDGARQYHRIRCMECGYNHKGKIGK